MHGTEHEGQSERERLRANNSRSSSRSRSRSPKKQKQGRKGRKTRAPHSADWRRDAKNQEGQLREHIESETRRKNLEMQREQALLVIQTHKALTAPQQQAATFALTRAQSIRELTAIVEAVLDNATQVLC